MANNNEDDTCKGCGGTGKDDATEENCAFCDGTGHDTEDKYDNELESADDESDPKNSDA